jgi:hypothetical protein
VTSTHPTASRLLAHNIDALLALLALPVFLVAGWPAEGWFWATLFWALNRYVNIVVERRAAQADGLRGVAMMGASMLARPWVGMLALFLITKDNRTMAISSVLLLLLLLSVDIGTRIATHRRGNVGDTV